MDPIDASASKNLCWDDQCIGKEEMTMQVDISWEQKQRHLRASWKWVENLEKGDISKRWWSCCVRTLAQDVQYAATTIVDIIFF